MTERLADVSARIDGTRQLGAVVNAMRGIAAARAQQARAQLAAVDSYAATIAAAIARAVVLLPVGAADMSSEAKRPALVLFCAEQGFAGAFSERVLDAAGAELAACELFLVGSRGAAAAAERHIVARWKSAMPSHSLGIPGLADRIAEALYGRIAKGAIDALDAVFSRWEPGHGSRVERRRLFPLGLGPFRGIAAAGNADAPLVNLAPDVLLGELIADYVHAQLCNAALHAFAAENEARMEAMASAHRQVDRRLARLQTEQRRVRQEEITAEIIELAAGNTAGRGGG